MAILLDATIYDLEETELCYVTRIRLQNGFNARNLSGGMLSRVNLAKEQS